MSHDFSTFDDLLRTQVDKTGFFVKITSKNERYNVMGAWNTMYKVNHIEL